VFVNNQHGVKRQGQDFDLKSLYVKGYTAKRLTDEFPDKSWTKRCVNKLFKKLRDKGTVNRRGQAAADRAVPALKKTLSLFFRSSLSLPLTLFCRLSGEVTESTFLSVKKTSQWHTAGTSEAEA